jgi:hypothetical protein
MDYATVKGKKLGCAQGPTTSMNVSPLSYAGTASATCG